MKTGPLSKIESGSKLGNSDQKPNSRMYNFVEVSGILRVLRLEVSVYNVYITNQFQPLLLVEEGGRWKIC